MHQNKNIFLHNTNSYYKKKKNSNVYSAEIKSRTHYEPTSNCTSNVFSKNLTEIASRRVFHSKNQTRRDAFEYWKSHTNPLNDIESQMNKIE